MAIEIEIAEARIEAGKLHLQMVDGRGWVLDYPPPANAIAQLQANIGGVAPEILRLIVFSLGGDVARLAGTKITADFANPAAMVKVQVPQ